MIEFTVFGRTLCYLHHAAVHAHACNRVGAGQTSGHLTEHAVGNGTYGIARCHRHIVHRTDIEIGIGSDHVRIGTGADVLCELCSVREIDRRLHPVDDIEVEDGSIRRIVNNTEFRAAACRWGYHDAEIVVEFLAHFQPECRTYSQAHVHGVGRTQRGAPAQCSRTVCTRRVTQNVECCRLGNADDVLG